MNRQSGFTLVELTLVASLLAMVTLGVTEVITKLVMVLDVAVAVV